MKTLKEWRQREVFKTQKELSEELGLSVPHYNMLERRKAAVSLKVIRKFVELFGTEIIDEIEEFTAEVKKSILDKSKNK